MSRTCPFLRAALAPKILLGETDVGRLYVRETLSNDFVGQKPLEALDKLSECDSNCQLFSSCIPTGEGFASGCTLAHPDHFRA